MTRRNTRRGGRNIRGIRTRLEGAICEALEKRRLLAGLTIAQENALPGTPASQWDVGGVGDTTIQGYATDISINQGQTVKFKINDTQSAAYHIDIYRMGYYQGNGARFITSIPSSQTLEQVQPNPITDPVTGLVDAGNWAVSASWASPSTATSGIYFANVVRDDTGARSQIYFIVRNDTSTSNVLFKTDDATWEAYNQWGGGNSFYTGTSTAAKGGTAVVASYQNRAVAVSYNRPFTDRGQAFGVGFNDQPFYAEYPMVRWMEANGYDVTYFSSVDCDRNGALIKNHKVLMDAGHDEYWSAAERNNVLAARNAGVSLAFFSGNEMYWKTRYINSTSNTDGTTQTDRVLVCYKETWANAPIDPTDPTTWTGTWRDRRFSPPADGGKPENSLTGTLFMVDQGATQYGSPISVPATDASLRFWRNTSVASLQPGQTATLGQFVLGYEWDADVDNGSRPAGLIDLSSTTQGVSELLLDDGNTVVPGTATHSLTLYRAPGGALVFSAASVQWAWGLDAAHDGPATTPDASMRQATVNLLAEMGVQPATLQADLLAATPSTDTIAPVSTITSPAAGAALTSGVSVTVTGTAVDAGGGVVAGVEVSTDGGSTWHRAVGTSSWTYTWVPGVTGTVKILSRAVDDSVNLETPSAGVSVTVAAPTAPLSIWSNGTVPNTPDIGDAQAVEVGVRFTSDLAGYITGIRFYKASGNTGTHIGNLWSSTGSLLASATFTNETASGWQQVTFSQPVAVTKGTAYVASYHTDVGHYAADIGAFSASAISNGPLHALQDTSAGRNGMYAYSAGSTFPINPSLTSTNYYVDVVFATAAILPPAVIAQTPASDALNVQTTLPLTITFSKAVKNTFSFTLADVAGRPIAAAVSYDSANHIASLTPTAALTSSTVYNATISGVQDSQGNTMAPLTWSFTTAPSYALWPSSAVPGTPASGDSASVNLGVKFHTDVAGFITGIRFYKGPGNTGAHVGSLWTGGGQLLASATFTSETPSGWQEVNFLTPVAITANTDYVAAYLAPVGHYALDGGYFTSTGVDSGPLHAPAGANGLFTYSGSPAFPANSFNSSNYWVDAVFGSSPLTVTSQTPAPNSNFVSTSTNATATFNESINPSTLSFLLKDANNSAVSATVTYVDSTHTATLTPSAPLSSGATYTATVNASDANGNSLPAPASWSFSTGSVGSSSYSFWTASTTPVVADANDTGSVDLGVKFRSDVSGYVTGVRFYKGPTNTGSHVGELWTSGGTPLASAVFNTETASGWQTVTFANPVAISAGTVYVASYHTNVGRYADDQGYFATTGVDSGPIHALANNVSGANGVYAYGAAGTFPGNSFNSSNYWVDIVFSTTLANNPPSVVSQTPASGATGVAANTTVTATFNESIQPTTLSFVLTDASNNIVPSTVTYVDSTHTATLTPTSALSNSITYTATVSGAQDSSGNPLTVPFSWSFTTAASVGAGPYSFWTASTTPATADVNDPNAVELGVKFTSDVSGFVTDLRFYKGPTNTGTHVGSLWTGGGTLLARATFSSETASGWQTVTFANPVAISAGTVYVASYHTNAGNYANNGSYFATAGVDSGPIHAPSNGAAGGNGVYAYSSTSAFPNQTFNSSNYWVDVVFATSIANNPPAVTSESPAPNAIGVAPATSVSATFSESIQPGTLSFTLKDASNNLVPSSVAYNDATHTATLTPNATLNASSTYTANVSGAADLSGTVMAAPMTWSFTTGSNQWTQSTVSNFSAGTQSGTAITNTAGGEEQLAQGVDDFAGTTLAASWTTKSWASQGGGPTSVTVANSILSVAGAQVSSAQVPASTPVEATLAFSAAPYEHFGIATDMGAVAGNSWAVFSTLNTTNTLFARVNASGVTQDVNIGALPSGFHDYLIQPVSGGFRFFVDGTLLTTILTTLPGGAALKTVFSSFGSSAVQIDSVKFGAYVSTGTFVSTVFDAGTTATWGAISWTADVPAGTTIQVFTSSGNTATPDSSWSAWTQVNNGGTVASPPARYVRFMVILTSSNSALTPVLYDVTINWH